MFFKPVSLAKLCSVFPGNNRLSGKLLIALAALLVTSGYGVQGALAATPQIDSLSTATATLSGRVLINGANFGDTQNGGHVEVGGVKAHISRWTDTLVAIYVPETAPTGSLSVVVFDGGGAASNSAALNVTLRPASVDRIRWRFTLDADYTLGHSAVGADGTASAGNDYVGASGTLTFNTGETTRTLNVTVNGDQFAEADETFTLYLTNPTNATLAQATGTARIVNDDLGGVLQFGSSGYSVREDGGTATINVTRTAGLADNVTVAYTTSNSTAQAGADYTATTGTLTFAAGETSKSFTVAILNDSLNEADETLNLSLMHVAGGATLGTPSTASLTIINEDTPTVQFSESSYQISEDGGSLNIVVERTGDASGDLTVNYSSSDSAGLQNCDIVNNIASSRCDYVSVVGTLHFAPTQTRKTISVPIVDDVYVEGQENFSVSLTNPAGAQEV